MMGRIVEPTAIHTVVRSALVIASLAKMAR
jgi:hypothetical protein